jgi:hypothetical protein
VSLAQTQGGKTAAVLKGKPAAQDFAEASENTRSLPHGHVATVLGNARRLRLERH